MKYLLSMLAFVFIQPTFAEENDEKFCVVDTKKEKTFLKTIVALTAPQFITIPYPEFQTQNDILPFQKREEEFKNMDEMTYEGTEITETSHLLFMIYWDDDFNCWQRGPAFACRNASSHHEAGDWMMKEITSAGSEAHDSDYFKNGTLEVIK